MRTGRADGSLEQGSVPVDGEFRLAIEDDEHLFVLIVEVMAHAAAARHHLAAMHEVEVHGHGIAGNQGHACHVAHTAVGAALAILGRIGMSDALRQRLGRHQRHYRGEK